jgi:hypothetical protein
MGDLTYCTKCLTALPKRYKYCYECGISVVHLTPDERSEIERRRERCMTRWLMGETILLLVFMAVLIIGNMFS